MLGVDRFMSEARAMTNLIGNGVATIGGGELGGRAGYGQDCARNSRRRRVAPVVAE